ncbi:Phosphatidate phosphatase LPIN1 [Myotis brandtii]|uniref:phosphatidate phosphatase n=1 Tax=Myotis brandtii TaxID=109478 RepID=S7MVB0_MYOBR|nr:Phosphatidate phosphatase LPIN1 [Myotis brandtii]
MFAFVLTLAKAQTMNYVGQLAGQVFVTVKELYKGLNPATLSGCIDIIVVRQPNGSLQCSPFHVRFGKMGVLRSREKVVDIEINGESVDLHMKLGDNGEAFFVQETDNDQVTGTLSHGHPSGSILPLRPECTSLVVNKTFRPQEVIPTHLATSPILSDGASRMECQLKRNPVDIEINGESVDLHMKLGDNGEAFFVQETDNDQEVIPTHLATSPILSDGASRMECQLKRNPVDRARSLDPSGLPPGETPSSGSLVKKRRKRRRKSQLDSLKRDDNSNTSEDEDMFPIEMSSDEERDAMDSSRTLSNDIPPFQEDVPKENVPPVMPYSQSSSYPSSDREWSPNASSLIDCKRTPPHVAVAAEGLLSSSCPPQSSVLHALESPSGSRPSTPKSDSELVSKSADRTAQKSNLEMLWLWGELPQAAKSPTHKMKDSSPLSSRKFSEKMHFQAIHSEPPEAFSDPSPPLAEAPPPQPLSEQSKSQTEMQFVNEEDVEALGAAAPPLPATEEPKALSALAASKTDSPSRKKDKRSRHLGADGVYLDDLTDMDPEVAALYFPKNGDPSALPKHADNGARSANQSPQSVGSSGADSGVESTSDGLRDLPSIAISLCGGLSDNREITKDAFLEQAVSYQQFVDNPALIDDPNLVVKIGNKYYNWTTAAPLLLAMQAFQKPLPKATVEAIMRDKMPRKGGRWWFSWRGRSTTIKEESKPEQGLAGESHSTGEQPPPLSMATRMKQESSSSDEEHSAARPSSAPLMPLMSNVGYKKTLRLTSEQLKSLKLKNGPNDVVFSVTTQYQGTCRCEGTIYLWNWDDKVIISDIDGTITRSDTLGHILPTLGKDWTHQGIAKLYHKVSQEVIEKKPEKFKVQCLTDIRNLFFPNTEPFYAAFGNRPADVYSYKQVGVSLNRIFTVNPKGELVQEHAKTNISSYVRLCEVVDHVFPLLKRSHSSDFPCSDTFSDFTFWREPLPPFENQDVHSASA